MIDAKLDNDDLALGWAMFWAKALGAIVWLMASLVAARAVILSQMALSERVMIAIVATIPSFTWIYLSAYQIRRSDEFNQTISRAGLRMGNSWAVLFGPVFVGFVGVEGALARDQIDPTHIGYLMLFTQPPIALLFGTLLTQLVRWRYGRKGQA